LRFGHRWSKRSICESTDYSPRRERDDHRQRRLLRAHCKRPSGRAAECEDEFAPSKANAHLGLPSEEALSGQSSTPQATGPGLRDEGESWLAAPRRLCRAEGQSSERPPSFVSDLHAHDLDHLIATLLLLDVRKRARRGPGD
jgi:hypothetical protein